MSPRKILADILVEENERWPGWEPPSPWAAPSPASLEMEEQECRLADAIICPSEFVAQSLCLLGTPAEKIHLLPYGVDPLKFLCQRQPWTGQRPLRLLFMGGVGLIKGIPYFYQALEQLNTRKIDTRLVGSVSIQEPHRSLISRRIDVVGQVPRSEVLQHYAWADVLVFPSLCEGSATVTYEALAAGLPVITTPNAGSVVRDGVDGYIVPIRDAEAIAAKLELLAGDPHLLARMAANAQNRAQEFSWDNYGDRLISTIKKIMSAK
jgi:glycosyltransferase involved in cell wall biosynthesis